MALHKLKTMEMLMVLSAPDIRNKGFLPPVVSREQVRIAVYTRKRITEDLTVHVTIDQIKDELHVGSTAVKTAFKNVYGQSVYAYLKDCRIREARRLLRDTDLQIGDIAMKAGYLNPGKFSAAFKEICGITPRGYRNVMRTRQ